MWRDILTGSDVPLLTFTSDRETCGSEWLFAHLLNDIKTFPSKIAVYTFYTWGYVLLCILSSWQATSMIVGRVIICNLRVVVGGLLIGGVGFLLTAYFSGHDSA